MLTNGSKWHENLKYYVTQPAPKNVKNSGGRSGGIRSIGGSVVEFSPATREARVRFPANASHAFLLALKI